MKEEEIDNILKELGPKVVERRTNYILAQKQMVEYELKVNYMIRVEPRDPWDSGWRFLHGNETEEMTERKEIFGCYNPSDFLYKGNEAIPKYLDSPIGSKLKRDGDDFVLYDSSPKESAQVIEMVTKDIAELQELLAENYDLLPYSKSRMAREEYINTMSAKISSAPQLLYDETIDILRDNIQKQKQINEEIIKRKEKAEQEKVEREARDKKSRAEYLTAKVMIFSLVCFSLFSAVYQKILLRRPLTTEVYLKAALAILFIICIFLFGMIYFTGYSCLSNPPKREKIIARKRIGILFAVISVVCLICGKLI